MATIATRAAGLTESRATYLARPPKSVVPGTLDPDAYQDQAMLGHMAILSWMDMDNTETA